MTRLPRSNPLSVTRLLRPDLQIKPTQNPLAWSVRDERSGKVYEFGAVETFLLTRLRKPYRTEDISKACNRRFEQNYTNQDIEDFVQMLNGWGLLTEKPNLVSEEPNLAHEKPNVAPGKLNGNHTADEAPETAVPLDGATAEPVSPSDLADQIRHPLGRHLFNPQPLLDGLLAIIYPLRLLLWLVPIIFVLGTLAVIFHWNAFVADLTRTMIKFTPFGRIAVEGVTVLLIDQIVRGLVARRFGMPTPSIGLRLLLGVIPRFHIRIIPMGEPDRRTHLWLAGGPMLMRFLLFGVCALVWGLSRTSGTFLSSIAVEITFLALLAILLQSNPLWRGDGPRFLSAWLEIPDIEKRRNRALLGLFIKEPAVIGRYTSRHRLFFALMGLVSTLFLVAVFGFVGWNVFLDLEKNFQGTGVAAFLVLIVIAFYGLFRTLRSIKEIKKSNVARRVAQESGVRSPPAGSPIKHSHAAKNGNTRHKVSGQEQKKGWVRWLKYALLLVFIICLFLPYTYHAGGQASVYPAARATLGAERDGILDKVYFNGGEQVRAGTPLAQMSDYQQIKDLETTKALLEAKKCDIEKMRTTPLKEQVELSEEQVVTARTISKYADEDLVRKTTLFKKGVLALQDFEDQKVTTETDRQKFVEAQASLEALKAEMNPNQIASAEAEAEMLKHEIIYYEEHLRRTVITTPIDGRIVTTNLQYQVGSFLKEGAIFAVVEDTRTIQIQVAVPQSQIGDVVVGAPVILRLWDYRNRDFTGVVEEVQAAALTSDTGSTVTITALMDNRDGLLKSGMTGYAKIRCETTPVIVAFTKALVLFVRVEIWSWLP